MKRYLDNFIEKDITKKMVFLGGARQVGKTTLAKKLFPLATYYNWDISEDRTLILKKELSLETTWIFDEIHKYRLWRSLLKGLFDKFTTEKKILVTGSARLDFYRYGGDSLQGRYYYLRLHPLSFAEIQGESKEDLQALFKLGGFPEPFLSGSETEARRWSREYRLRFIREDVLDLESILDLGRLEQLMLLLPEKVGSPLSINSLRDNLQLSHKTISRWLDIFERFYGIFRIPPFGSSLLRSVKKEQKHYHLDWTLVTLDSLRFENMIACHLNKWVDFIQDTEGRDISLTYFRDIDKREVAFVIVENKEPIYGIECKWNDGEVSPHLKYLKKRFPKMKAFQISYLGEKDFETLDGIRVCPARVLLKDFI